MPQVNFDKIAALALAAQQRVLQQQKAAFVPPPPPPGGAMPPGAPPAGPPMDPAMMGGMPPVDPAMMGGMPPMDPAMMGGMPPMDPAMMGGMPPAAPAPAPAPAGGGEGGGKEKVKVDVPTELRQIKLLLAKIVDTLGISVPAQALLDPGPQGGAEAKSAEFFRQYEGEVSDFGEEEIVPTSLLPQREQTTGEKLAFTSNMAEAIAKLIKV